MKSMIVVCALSCILVGSVASAQQFELIGIGEIPIGTADKSGLAGNLEDGTPHNRFGGISGIDRIANTDDYLALTDRGPKDGAVSWQCRVHRLNIQIDLSSSQPVTVQLIDTVMLRDSRGCQFTGKATAISTIDSGSCRFDPEGIRCTKSGSFFVSDEYGPCIVEFDKNGNWLRSPCVPQSLCVAIPSAGIEENTLNNCGRQANRGIEGLATGPDGKLLFGLLQSPLIQDCRRNELGGLDGLNCRLLAGDANDGFSKQFVYRLDSNSNKLCEILAIDAQRFLVIERDGLIGAAAVFKRIMLVDLTYATDVSRLGALPADDLPEAIRSVEKSTLIDFLDPKYKLAGELFPEKLEGLTWGPDLPDGRRTLIVAVDNDFFPEKPSLFYVFAGKF